MFLQFNTRLRSSKTDASGSSSNPEINAILNQIAELQKICLKTNACVAELQATVNKLLVEGNKTNSENITRNDQQLNAISELKGSLIDGCAAVSADLKSKFNEVCASSSTKTFSSIVKSNPVVIIKPKTTQSCVDTRNALRSNVDPAKIPLHSVKNAASGSVVIECENTNGTDRIIKDVSEKLGSSYEVKVVNKRLPKIRIMGLSELLPANELVKTILDQNSELFSQHNSLKIVSTFTYNKASSHGIKAELDPVSFNKVMASTKLRIGWDVCPVFEAFDLLRCFNCLEYHHAARNCTSVLACSKCSGSHRFSECTAKDEQCTNCLKAAAHLNLNLDVAHSATSPCCPVYIRKIESEKKRVNYA